MDTENLYRKRECELCGSFVFEKFIKDVKELDGGFTHVEEWEKSGFGSMVIVTYELDPEKNPRHDLHLCPKCAEELSGHISKILTGMKMRYGGGEVSE